MRIRTHFKTRIITLVSVAQSLSVRPIFASTESQESKYYIGVHNRTWQCALGPFLRPDGGFGGDGSDGSIGGVVGVAGDGGDSGDGSVVCVGGDGAVLYCLQNFVSSGN